MIVSISHIPVACSRRAIGAHSGSFEVATTGFMYRSVKYAKRKT